MKNECKEKTMMDWQNLSNGKDLETEVAEEYNSEYGERSIKVIYIKVVILAVGVGIVTRTIMYLLGYNF